MTVSQSRNKKITPIDTLRSLHFSPCSTSISMQSTVASSYFDSASDGTTSGGSPSESIPSSPSFVRDEIDGSHTLPDIAEGSYEPHTSDEEPTIHTASIKYLLPSVSFRGRNQFPALRRRKPIFHDPSRLTPSSLSDSDRYVRCPSDRADR
jgi:hypothetical protein